MYRSSTGTLDHYDDAPPRGGERWDRDRFERMARRAPPPRDVKDDFHFHEHDRFPGGRRDIDIREDYERRAPPTRVMEREREVFREDDRFDRRRRHDLFDEPTPSQIANQALAPYRRKSVVDRDFELDIHREQTKRPARPQYIRRQSSLDTFDRRPLPRYGDRERDEWRPPANVPIPLPIRERRRSPPRYQEEEFEEERFMERDRPGRRDKVEEYREVEVHRAKSRRRRSPSRSVAHSVAQSAARSSSTSSFEEIKLARAEWGKKGKTRLPKRLCRVQAVTELGYPYEEEEDFIVITRALEKDHIDEIISVSEKYKETKMTYVYEDARSVIEQPPVMMAPPPPPPPPPVMEYVPPPPPPPPASVHGNTVVYERSVRGVSPPRSHHHEHFEERIEESNHIGGPLTVLVPEERRVVRRERDVRSEREIREEIRMLEDERRMLKYERDGDYEIVERREKPREVIRIEKDRKGRREPSSKLVAAMMATLT